MSAIKVETELTFETLLQAVEQLSMPDLETLTAQVLNLRAKRKAPCLSVSESELLLKINQTLSPQRQTKFNALVAKRQAETLTEEERQELIDLNEHIERNDAERLQCLTELARLRGIELEALMEDLGIKPPAYA